MNTSDAKSDRHDGGCKPLLEACTPFLYRHNAFRITGLPVDATTRDIKRRIDDLKHAAELGSAEDEHSHAFALNPPPDLEQIRIAAQRLNDPERRIVDEFFWFWPLEWGKGKHDQALQALMRADKDTAFKAWNEMLAMHHSPPSIVAKHNLAVMYHLVAIDSEHVALSSDLSAEQMAAVSKHWRMSFKWWEELTDHEPFWSHVADRIRMMDDQALTTGFARRMRTALPEAMDKINAMLAISFAEKNKLSLVSAHITYMKETHQGLDDVPKTLASITGPLKTRIRSAIERVNDRLGEGPEKAGKRALDLLEIVVEPLEIIRMILPADDHERVDLCDAVADTCLQCQVAYGRATKDWALSLRILDQAVTYAASAESIKNINENRAIVFKKHQVGQYIGPLEQALEALEGKGSVAERLRAVETTVLPQLRSIERLPGIAASVTEECADLVAIFVRDLSIEAHNKLHDIQLSARAHDLARSIAKGNKLKEQIDRDASQLAVTRLEADVKTLVEKGPASLQTMATIEAVIARAMQSAKDVKTRDDVLRISAYILRAFSIRVCNENNAYVLGHGAIMKALEYAAKMATADIELLSRLRDDSAVVSANMAAAPQKSSSGCFVATAVYGDFNHPSVVVLRRFRDEALLPTHCGRAFVRIYYRIGPTLAKMVVRSAHLSKVCRDLLDLLVKQLERRARSSNPRSEMRL